MREKVERLKAQAGIVDFSATYDSDPVRWIERYFYIPETNKAIVLEEYQRAVISEALRRDVSGNFVYSFILWSDLKKSAKSTIAAAVCLYLAWHTPWESIRVVANDLKQANSRTFFYIERAIRLNPILNAVCKRIKYHIELPNHTAIDAIPVDPKGEAGGGDLVTCFTELWAMKNEASKQLWTETTLSPLKFGKSLRWAESYAGIETQSPLLENAFNAGVKEGRLIDLGIPGLEIYANDSARMLALWNTQPRCSWQTKEYYAQESATLTPEEFNRVHRNQWASNTHQFIPIQWFDDCRVESLPPCGGVVVGMDAGVHDDCFAIVVVSKNVDRISIREVNVWQAQNGGVVPIADVKEAIRRICKTYHVECIAYDEYQLAFVAQELDDLAFWEVFSQGAARAVADKKLYDLIRERKIEHAGLPVLREHLLNADSKPEDDAKLRLVKRNQAAKIDAVVALSQACSRALYYNI
jgi:phage terminase large subunit-like protein